jgi:hypothetical protein
MADSLADFVPDFNLDDTTPVTAAPAKKRGRPAKVRDIEVASSEKKETDVSESRRYTKEDVEFVVENYSLMSKEDIAEKRSISSAQVSRIIGRVKKNVDAALELESITQEAYDKIMLKLTPPKKERKKKSEEDIFNSVVTDLICQIKN